MKTSFVNNLHNVVVFGQRREDKSIKNMAYGAM
jgi:hypothetical protein